jgi:hypothetical protein
MKINGKIVDINNEPLSGANITLVSGEKAFKVGVISDLDGNFNLERDDFDGNSMFQISYVGFEPQKIKASELVGKTIVLKEDVFGLGEVVITGQKPKQPENQLSKIMTQKRMAYAGVFGLLGIALIAISYKKL